jgi:hypothetical protein
MINKIRFINGGIAMETLLEEVKRIPSYLVCLIPAIIFIAIPWLISLVIHGFWLLAKKVRREEIKKDIDPEEIPSYRLRENCLNLILFVIN